MDSFHFSRVHSQSLFRNNLPKKPDFIFSKVAFRKLGFWFLLKISNTSLRWSSCSLPLEKTRISSTNTTINLLNCPLNTLLIKSTKYAGAFVSPKGITHRAHLEYGMRFSVFFPMRSSSDGIPLLSLIGKDFSPYNLVEKVIYSW